MKLYELPVDWQWCDWVHVILDILEEESAFVIWIQYHMVTMRKIMQTNLFCANIFFYLTTAYVSVNSQKQVCLNKYVIIKNKKTEVLWLLYPNSLNIEYHQLIRNLLWEQYTYLMSRLISYASYA